MLSGYRSTSTLVLCSNCIALETFSDTCVPRVCDGAQHPPPPTKGSLRTRVKIQQLFQLIRPRKVQETRGTPGNEEAREAYPKRNDYIE